MVLELRGYTSVAAGLIDLNDKAFNFSKVMDARIKDNLPLEGPDIWDIPLDSRTINLLGGFDKRYGGMQKFKIDHGFDLDILKTSKYNGDITDMANFDEAYNNSKGTEFIIINREGIDYAILVENYEDFKKYEHNIRSADFVKFFHPTPLNFNLSGAWIMQSGVWHELANEDNGTITDSAINRLSRYIEKAYTKGCFSAKGSAMAVLLPVNTPQKGITVWRLSEPKYSSIANGKASLFNDAYLLRKSSDLSESSRSN